MADETQLEDPELSLLKLNKQSGYNYRERRQDDWEENYTLYRDKVVVNRLTQRQSINLPLMKKVIRTLLKDVDDMPVMQFENLDNDKESEIFLNEYWKYIGSDECNKFELQDIVDKRQVLLFGRSFDSWQIVDGKPKMTIEDPQDILVSRFMDPFNLHSSRFLIHTHIFKPLSTLEENPDYNKEAIDKLKVFYATEQGIIKAGENQTMLEEKNKKMSDMGVSDVSSPVLGETYVELSLHFVFRDNEVDADGNKMESQIFLYVECDDMEILMKKPLEEIIGVTKDHWWRKHYPYNSWADDLERQDFWSDSAGDIVRPANKVLNADYSQLVENRTLRNFNMHYYDSSNESFNPNTFNPMPWGWYPIPIGDGKTINDVLQQVQVADLSDSLDEMEFMITMIETATGATATQQGAVEQKQITLGEVKIALSQAQERVKGMSKFYTPVWKERGILFLKLVEAASDKLDAVKISKKGRNTSNMYTRQIGPEDWMSKSGYSVRVWSQDDKNTQDGSRLERLNATVQAMPGNPKLMDIYQRKLLEFDDLTPDQISDIMDYEQQKRQAMINQPLMTGGQPAPQMGQVPPGAATGQPAQGLPPQGY